METKSLCFTLQDAASRLRREFYKIAGETAIPAYLLEGLLVSLLAEVREQKCDELYTTIRREKEKEKETASENHT